MKSNLPLVRCLVLSLLVAAPGLAQIVEVGSLPYSGIRDVWGDENYAYLNTATELLIVDISDPTQPALISNTSTSFGNDVKVSGGFAYAGAVDILDISDPTQPVNVGRLLGHNGHNLFVDNDLIFIANVNSSVPVYDISDPTNPQFIRNISVGGSVHDITVQDGRLYASSIGSGRTSIWDVTNVNSSSHPPLLASWASGSATHSNWPSEDGNLLVSARETGSGDVQIWDISDLSNPTLMSSIIESDFGATAFSPHNPLLVGDTLYVSWYEAGLRVFDISDPSNPVHLGGFDTAGNWGVYPFLGPDRILLSDFTSDELIIVDVRDVLRPGDFDGDSRFTCADIDDLVAQIATGTTDLHYDTNDDGTVNADDVDEWLALAGAANLPSGNAYLPGDANLDGTVNGEDFLIWNANKFASHAAWCLGDFTADGEVDGADFLRWNENKFTSADVSAVPEPVSRWALALAVCLCVLRHRWLAPANLVFLDRTLTRAG